MRRWLQHSALSLSAAAPLVSLLFADASPLWAAFLRSRRYRWRSAQWRVQRYQRCSWQHLTQWCLHRAALCLPRWRLKTTISSRWQYPRQLLPQLQGVKLPLRRQPVGSVLMLCASRSIADSRAYALWCRWGLRIQPSARKLPRVRSHRCVVTAYWLALPAAVASATVASATCACSACAEDNNWVVQCSCADAGRGSGWRSPLVFAV